MVLEEALRHLRPDVVTGRQLAGRLRVARRLQLTHSDIGVVRCTHATHRRDPAQQGTACVRLGPDVHVRVHEARSQVASRQIHRGHAAGGRSPGGVDRRDPSVGDEDRRAHGQRTVGHVDDIRVQQGEVLSGGRTGQGAEGKGEDQRTSHGRAP